LSVLSVSVSVTVSVSVSVSVLACCRSSGDVLESPGLAHSLTDLGAWRAALELELV
jgi:hypothetical protein